MEDNKFYEFYVICWILVAAVVTVVVLAATVYSLMIDIEVVRSKDPVAARCALGGSSAVSACLVYAARR